MACSLRRARSVICHYANRLSKWFCFSEMYYFIRPTVLESSEAEVTPLWRTSNLKNRL